MRRPGPSSSPAALYVVLALGVAAVSVAAPLIRAAAAPPLSLSAYRLGLAAAPILAVAIWRRGSELRGLSRADWQAVAASGLFLAAHFAAWVASLRYGTVASSVALVTTSPLFVAAFARFVTGEGTSRATLLAMLVCVAGGFVIGAADWRAGGHEILADVLALAGAAFAAAYYALGRRVRSRISVLSYAAAVYTVAAMALLLAALALRQPLSGFSGHTYLIFAVLALVPQIVGHSALNWALGYLTAPFVSIAVLGEPILATLLTALFLHEFPGPQRIAGGLLLLAGVYLAIRDERQRAAAAARATAPAAL